MSRRSPRADRRQHRREQSRRHHCPPFPSSRDHPRRQHRHRAPVAAGLRRPTRRRRASPASASSSAICGTTPKTAVDALNGAFTLVGSITSGGAVAGQLSGLAKPFSGNVDASSGPAQASAGLYTAAALGTESGTTHLIVGASGQVVAITTGTTAVDGATGTINAAGQFTATTSQNGQLSVAIDPNAQTLNASLTPAGASAPITFAGQSSTVTVDASLANLSVRTNLALHQNLIVGFVVDGGAKPILLRAAGLALLDFELVGVADPRLTLIKDGTTVTTNDNWDASLAPTFSSLGAFTFDSGSKDAAILQTISGPHSAHATATGSGVILVEAYDAALSTSPRLVNLSARSRAGSGDDVLIAGFVLSGTGNRQVLVRGVGPSLARYQVTGLLNDPQLTLYDGTTAIATNDNWSADLSATFTQIGAFELDAGSKDAAFIVTLQAGRRYSAQVSGVDGSTGEALVEIYLLP